MLPVVSAAVMDLFLAQFAAALPADAHAVLVLDGAGWHDARALTVPGNLTLVPLPAYSPELNPVERIWLYQTQRRPVDPVADANPITARQLDLDQFTRSGRCHPDRVVRRHRHRHQL